MGRPCSTCALPASDLVALHDEVDSGTSSLRSIAHRHSLEPRSLARHLESHRSRTVAAEVLTAAGGEQATDSTLLARAEELVRKVDRIIEANEKGAPVIALKGVSEARLLLASISTLLAKLEERRTSKEFDLRLTAAWRELRDIVEAELASCPGDCRSRLVLALTRPAASRGDAR